MILRCSGISLLLPHSSFFIPLVFCHQDCCHNFWFPPQAEAPAVTSSILCVAQPGPTPAQLLGQQPAPSGHGASFTVMGGLGIGVTISLSSIQIWEQGLQSQIRHSTSPKCFVNHPSLQTLPSQEVPRGKPRVCIAYATDPCPCCLVVKSGVPAPWMNGMMRALGRFGVMMTPYGHTIVPSPALSEPQL